MKSGKAAEGSAQSGRGHSLVWFILLGPALLVFLYVAYAITSLPSRGTRDRHGPPHPFTLVDSDAASASFIPASTSLSGPWLPTNPQPFIRLKGINVAAAVISSSTQIIEERCAATCIAAKACNGYAYCGDKAKCQGNGASTWQSCELKAVPDVTKLDTRQAGAAVGWTSGVLWSRANVPALLKARGYDPLITSSLVLGVRNGTCTIETISPRDDPTFSYAHASDSSSHNSAAPGYHHLGDMSMRLKQQGDKEYKSFSTVRSDGVPEHRYPRKLPNLPNQLFKVDLTPSLPDGCPVTVSRWLEVPNNTTAFSGPSLPTSTKRPHPAAMWLPGEVHVWFEVVYGGGAASGKGGGLDIGALGFSMPLDQYFKGLKLEQVAAQASFVEGYPGGAFGYVQVTRASGKGPVLLILPLPGTSFEAWRPLKSEDKIYGARDFAFEGTFEIMVHSKAWAEAEWRNAAQWVTPSSHHLSPGQSVTYGFRLLLAPDPQHVEDTLLAAGHPVAVGVPGFTLHADMREGRLLLRTPQGLRLHGMVQEPQGALEVEQLPSPSAQPTGTTLSSFRMRAAFSRNPNPGEGVEVWEGCQLGSYQAAANSSCPCFTGRMRLRLQFAKEGAANGTVYEQVIQLLIVPPARTLVTNYGRISSHPDHGWLPADTGDLWGRGPAFMGYDNEKKFRIMDELRVFMSGLSDEAGMAQPVGMAIKQLYMPVPDEVQKLEQYVHQTLLQRENQTDRTYLQDRQTSAIRASLFYYEDRPEFQKLYPEWHRRCKTDKPFWLNCWDKARSETTWRGPNYPHVATIYWVLYRLSRMHSPPLATAAPWEWYLRQSAKTIIAMWRFGEKFAKWGLMEGSGFPQILEDVQREGLTDVAAELEQTLMKRVRFWQSQTFPFGSEMPWDNTGQEEIYTWLDYVGDEEGADMTIQAITAYDALYPHWGLSGSARRWWDFFINGKVDAAGFGERVLQHYASPLNAVPLMQHYRKHPDQLFFLRLATAGLMASVANIKPDGGPSMGFHADPSMLKLDGYSADWGVGFYGYCTQATSVLTCDPSLGWLCFQCDITHSSPPLDQLYTSHAQPCTAPVNIALQPRDALRSRLFIAPYGMAVKVEGAVIADAAVDTADGTISLQLADALLRYNASSAFALIALQRTGTRRMQCLQQRVEPAAGGKARAACTRASSMGKGVFRVDIASPVLLRML